MIRTMKREGAQEGCAFEIMNCCLGVERLVYHPLCYLPSMFASLRTITLAVINHTFNCTDKDL